MRKVSTMDISSTTMASALSGSAALRLKPPVWGENSRARWMVAASAPVVSLRRLAARPVGAMRRTRAPTCL